MRPGGLSPRARVGPRDLCPAEADALGGSEARSGGEAAPKQVFFEGGCAETALSQALPCKVDVLSPGSMKVLGSAGGVRSGNCCRRSIRRDRRGAAQRVSSEAQRWSPDPKWALWALIWTQSHATDRLGKFPLKFGRGSYHRPAPDPQHQLPQHKIGVATETMLAVADSASHPTGERSIRRSAEICLSVSGPR